MFVRVLGLSQGGHSMSNHTMDNSRLPQIKLADFNPQGSAQKYFKVVKMSIPYVCTCIYVMN